MNPFWKSKKPPIYVWEGDQWQNEENGHIYTADLDNLMWRLNEDLTPICADIPFPPKTQIRSRK